MVRTPGLAIARHIRSAVATSLPASRIRPISRFDFNSGCCKRRNIKKSQMRYPQAEIRDKPLIRILVSLSDSGFPETSLFLLDCLHDVCVDRFDVAAALDRAQQSLAAVMLDHILGTGVVDFQTVAHCFLAIIRALDQFLAIDIADAGDLRRFGLDMVRCLAARTDPAAGDPVDDFLIWDDQEDDSAQVQELLPQDSIESSSLRDGPRITIHQEM